MIISELAGRMRSWLAGDYRAKVRLEQEKIIAYALYREGQDEIYLRQFFVITELRRQGIGRAFMRHLIDRIWSAEKRMTVEVLAGNLPAIAFWREMGYRDYAISLKIMPSERKPAETKEE
jgi:GNAT superfamily N-acetyltransferase